MPRPPRYLAPGLPHHVTQRGNYKQRTFFRAGDCLLYLDLLRDYSRHYGVSILAYCLMPTHVHLIAVPQTETALPRAMQRLHSEYARATHVRLRRVGHLWQARYYSTPLDEEHFWAAMLYVEHNPVRAGLCERAEDWRWTSARAHLAGTDGGLLDLIPWRERHTPESWKRCLDMGLRNAALFERIREATVSGRPAGGEAFLDRLEQEFRLPVRRRGRGRPSLMEATTSVVESV